MRTKSKETTKKIGSEETAKLATQLTYEHSRVPPFVW